MPSFLIPVPHRLAPTRLGGWHGNGGRGLSSAASAANAAVDHMRDWIYGTPEDDWVSMGVLSDGSYGVPEGLIYGFPVRCKQGQYHIVQDLDISERGHKHMQDSYRELLEEREHVKHLLG